MTRAQDCLALLAWERPECAPTCQLVQPGHAAAVAQQLNGALLGAAGLPERTALEQLARHAEVLQAMGAAGS